MWIMEGCHHLHNETNIKKLCISIVPMFQDLSQQEMEEIARTSKHQQYQKGELLIQAGEPTEHLYIIHTGRVKMYRLSDSGKEQLIRILEPGDFLGELSLFSQHESDSYAETMINSDVCSIHRKSMTDILLNYPSISLKLLGQLSSRLEKTENLVGRLSLQDVEKRTASYLVEMAEKFDGLEILTLPMSKKDLASYLGTTQETISRRLSSFQDRGWIEQTGQRNIKIRNLDALRKSAES